MNDQTPTPKQRSLSDLRCPDAERAVVLTVVQSDGSRLAVRLDLDDLPPGLAVRDDVSGYPVKPDGSPGLPPKRLDWSQRRFSHCQADEDGCTYEQCPRWRDGRIINEAHCALDLIGRDDDA